MRTRSFKDQVLNFAGGSKSSYVLLLGFREKSLIVTKSIHSPLKERKEEVNYKQGYELTE